MTFAEYQCEECKFKSGIRSIMRKHVKENHFIRSRTQKANGKMDHPVLSGYYKKVS